MPQITLVVPCYNEAHRIDVDAFAAFAGEHETVGLVFVNDGSSDGTLEVLTKATESIRRASVLNLPTNQGKGEAVRVGVLSAFQQGSDLFGYWDADLSTPLNEMFAMAALFDTHPQLHLVMGSRVQLLGRNVTRRATRHYVGRVFATAASLTLGLPVYDTQCGAKLFRNNELTRGLFQDPFTTRWVFDVEILARLMTTTGAVSTSAISELVCEYPLESWTHVPAGNIRLRDFPASLWGLWRISRRYRPRRAIRY